MISKKELLKETGISYGQLYRWKREGLIPEEWFVKRSSFTGQETFLPAEKALKRVRDILEMKDEKSLEEMARIFYPDITDEVVAEDALAEIEEIDNEVLKIFNHVYGRNTFSHIELVFAACFSRFLRWDPAPDKDNFSKLIAGVTRHIEKLKTVDYVMTIVKNENEYSAVIYKDGQEVFLSKGGGDMFTVRLEDVSEEIKGKFEV